MTLALALLFALPGLPQAQPGAERRVLPDSIPRAVVHARKLRRFDLRQKLDALVCFKFADPTAAQACADAVSDPNSPLYGHWLTPTEIGGRFGPTPQDYEMALRYFQDSGLKIEETAPNRMTARFSGTAAQMEAAFGVLLNEYQEAAQDAQARGTGAAPISFFASAAPIRLPANLADKISGVEGLESWTRPLPLLRRRSGTQGPFDPAQVRTAYDLAPLYAAGFQGQGRTIAISNYDGFSLANARLYVTYNNLPVPAGGAASNVSVITVASSSGAYGVGEGDLDMQMVLGMAPLANILVYDNGKPFNNNVPQNVLGVLAREVADNQADIITESYGWPVADAAQINSWHTQHVMMTMQGITYLVASGDSGSIVNYQYPYPAIEPEILDVGGTIATLNGDNTLSSETGWSGSGGGYNAAAFAFNFLPAWQKGRSVPTGLNYRLVPDIALHSAGPNSTTGAYNFYYFQTLFGSANGTSFASPIVAAGLLDIEQYLISQNALPPDSHGKRRLGRLNDRLYAFNGRDDIFHDIMTGGGGANFSAGPYWDQVTGWGTPDFQHLAVALVGPLTVTVSPAQAAVAPGSSLPLTAQVTASAVTGVTWRIASGPGSVSSSGVYTAPASVTAPQTVSVQAVSVIDTANPGKVGATFQPDPVFGTAKIVVGPTAALAGTVALEGVPNPAGSVAPVNPITFTLRPAGGGAPQTFRQMLGAGGAFTLPLVPAGAYVLAVKGDRWLKAADLVDATNGNVSGLHFSLAGGDADNSNTVDVLDFGVLVNAYGGDVLRPGSGYDPTADFNCDGLTDVLDFGVLVNNYGAMGAP